MAKKPIKLMCGAVIGGSILVANYAVQHFWSPWSITIAGAIFLAAVVAYILTAQS